MHVDSPVPLRQLSTAPPSRQLIGDVSSPVSTPRFTSIFSHNCQSFFEQIISTEAFAHRSNRTIPKGHFENPNPQTLPLRKTPNPHLNSSHNAPARSTLRNNASLLLSPARPFPRLVQQRARPPPSTSSLLHFRHPVPRTRPFLWALRRNAGVDGNVRYHRRPGAREAAVHHAPRAGD